MDRKIIEKIKIAQKTPGVYIFYKKNVPLYIGKASSLKQRLKSYLKNSDYKTDILHQEATKLKFIQLASSVEALIWEARLIKELKPRLNICWQDDKNYFYVVFTKEKFPKIFITHRPVSVSSVGPFTDGKALRLVLKILRRHYPYCSCRQTHLRKCLNAQIGLCLGYCCRKQYIENYGSLTSIILEYQKNIKTIRDILRGKKKRLFQKIVKPSDEWAMENIIEHHPYLESQQRSFKIECYDISNFAGKEAVGAMTVLVGIAQMLNSVKNWEADRRQFRKFKIKYASTRDDPQMIAEILTRRLNHSEWPYPNLIIIDGGITQYNAAKKVLQNFLSFKQNQKNKIGLISFAKLSQKIYGDTNLSKEIIKKAIKQTHNYVIKYHRSIRVQVMLE